MQIFTELDFASFGKTTVPVVDAVGFIGTGDIEHTEGIRGAESLGFLCQILLESRFAQTWDTHHFILFFELGVKGKFAADRGSCIGAAIENVVVAECRFSGGQIDI